MRQETLYETYKRDKVAALQRCFDEGTRRMYSQRRVAFLSVSVAAQPQMSFGRMVCMRYGMFKNVFEDELSERTYQIEFWDGAPALFFTDVWHDPKAYRNYPRWLGGPLPCSWGFHA